MLLTGTGWYNIRTEKPTMDTDVQAKEYTAAVTLLDSFTKFGLDYQSGLFDFDQYAHAADPTWDFPQADETKAHTLIDTISQNDIFLDSHPNDAATWSVTLTHVAQMVTEAGNDTTNRDAEFNKICH
jgi:hypothetical protein